MIGAEFLHRPDLDNFVLVYTMGKVGSTALARSLDATNVFNRHVQWLKPETQQFLDTLWVSDAHDLELFLNRLNVERCRHALKDREYASLIKVITGFRAPVELILSHYFHSFGFFESNLKRQGLEVTAATVRANILDCVASYMGHPALGLAALADRLSQDNCDCIHFHWIVLNYMNWIDFELRPFFPAEISRGFGTRGYVLADNVLILKFEELATKGEAAVRAFVQRPHFKLARANVGADKAGGEIYREVLDTIKFPREFVEHLCDAKYVRLFYSPEERAAMKARWVE
jgi:hypothetical protein